MNGYAQEWTPQMQRMVVTPEPEAIIESKSFIIERQVDRECELIFLQLEADKKAKQLRERRERKKRGYTRTAPARNRVRPTSLPPPGAPYLDYLFRAIQPVQTWNYGLGFHNADRAMIHLDYAEGNFMRVIEAISKIFNSNNPPMSWDQELDEFWYDSHYQLNPKAKNKSNLTPVDKFRIRKKNRSPSEARTGRKRYKISRNAEEILKNHFRFNSRPSQEDKRNLFILTGLEQDTITNWFKNRRQREKKSKQGGLSGSQECLNSSAVSSEVSPSLSCVSSCNTQAFICIEEPYHEQMFFPDLSDFSDLEFPYWGSCAENYF